MIILSQGCVVGRSVLRWGFAQCSFQKLWPGGRILILSSYDHFHQRLPIIIVLSWTWRRDIGALWDPQVARRAEEGGPLIRRGHCLVFSLPHDNECWTMINVFHSSLQFLLNSGSCGVAHEKAGDLSGPLGASAGDPLWQGAHWSAGGIARHSLINGAHINCCISPTIALEPCCWYICTKWKVSSAVALDFSTFCSLDSPHSLGNWISMLNGIFPSVCHLTTSLGRWSVYFTPC